MTHFDELRGKALQNYGIVTAATATEMGLRTNELVRFCQDERLVRIGYGTYRLASYTPTKLTRFAEAIAIVGEGSYVYGRSVLVLWDLLPYEPGKVRIATAQRVRRALPDWIELQKGQPDAYVDFGGIPCQRLREALDVCMDQLTQDQLETVARICDEAEFIADAQRREILDRLGFSVRALAT